MAALQNAFKSYLDENRFWSYRETLFETIAVLWISTSISAELVKRYFPEWRASRMDPNAESLGFLWRMLGYGEDRCFWDRAMSFWKASSVSVCQNNSHTLPVPDSSETTIGYMGTYATLTATVLLYLLFFFSLFVNKSLREPVRVMTIPAFHQVENLFKLCGRKPKHCQGPVPQPGPKRCNEYCSVQEYSKFNCRVLGRCLLILVLCVLLIIPVGVVGCLVWVLIVLWTVVLLLPVVVLATAFARTASAILGEDAIVPCYILLALALLVYSAGRMAGLWMRSSYLLWICNVTKKDKTISTSGSFKAAFFGTVVEPASSFVVAKIIGYLLAMYVFAMAIGLKLEFLWFRPNIWVYGSESNGTHETTFHFNGIKMLNFWSAIESYWVKNGTVYDYTILPEPSVLSQTIGAFCDTWALVLVCFVLLSSFFGLLVYFIHDHAVGSIMKRHDPTNKRFPKWYTYLYDHRPQLASCWCSATLLCALFYTMFETPLFAMVVLPFPILNAFVPEHYHLPGLIVMNTACAVGAITTTVQWLWAHWHEYERYPHDPLGEKLPCGKHPLCGNYRRKACKRECKCAEEGGAPDEEVSILEVAVEKTENERSV